MGPVKCYISREKSDQTDDDMTNAGLAMSTTVHPYTSWHLESVDACCHIFYLKYIFLILRVSTLLYNYYN